ncbi:Phosphatidylinositol 5-phosphate 4-kinase type-2 gamma [Dictyocoela muelleri]|nr:Phosphatidylinositol 5-phosphate 4-kinase type-2 gamma [Dictyocoela muelleri]
MDKLRIEKIFKYLQLIEKRIADLKDNLKDDFNENKDDFKDNKDDFKYYLKDNKDNNDNKDNKDNKNNKNNKDNKDNNHYINIKNKINNNNNTNNKITVHKDITIESSSSSEIIKIKSYTPSKFTKIRNKLSLPTSLPINNISLTKMHGKSGSHFFFINNKTMILKTIRKKEKNVFIEISDDYFEYMDLYDDSLLCKIIGIYKISFERINQDFQKVKKMKIKNNNTNDYKNNNIKDYKNNFINDDYKNNFINDYKNNFINDDFNDTNHSTLNCESYYFILMMNMLPPREMNEIYDLKGSLGSRLADGDEMKSDLDWLERNKKLFLNSDDLNKFIRRVERDVDFLCYHDIMDYSLLLGIDIDCDTKNNSSKDKNNESKDNLFNESKDNLINDSKHNLINDSIDDFNLINLNNNNSKIISLFLPENDYLNIIRSKETYYFGIVDILTKYDFYKFLETLFNFCVCKSGSSLPPDSYKFKFMNLISKRLFSDDLK